MGGVQGERPQQLPVLGQHPHIKIGDQDQHARAGMPAAQADVVQPAVVPQGDHPAVVDLVAAEAVVGRDGEPWHG